MGDRRNSNHSIHPEDDDSLYPLTPDEQVFEPLHSSVNPILSLIQHPIVQKQIYETVLLFLEELRPAMKEVGELAQDDLHKILEWLHAVSEVLIKSTLDSELIFAMQGFIAQFQAFVLQPAPAEQRALLDKIHQLELAIFERK